VVIEGKKKALVADILAETGNQSSENLTRTNQLLLVIAYHYMLSMARFMQYEDQYQIFPTLSASLRCAPSSLCLFCMDCIPFIRSKF
jgi:hypothetical protein